METATLKVHDKSHSYKTVRKCVKKKTPHISARGGQTPG